MKPAHLAHLEGVLLLEADPDGTPKFRTWTLDTRHPVRIDCIVERERDPVFNKVINERLWYWQHEERALTGQRIFREMEKPKDKEWQEDPLFDEMVVKKP